VPTLQYSPSAVLAKAAEFAAIADDFTPEAIRARNKGGLLPPDDDPFQKTYTRLDQELRGLDALLQDAIRRNSVLFWSRFGVILFLAVAVLVATCVMMAQQLYVEGSIAGAVDLGLIGWFLAGFRTLQDERFNLIFRIAAFRPRLAACDSLAGLQQLAREVAESLKFLSPQGQTGAGGGPSATGA
jgi:hypothetical protein